MPCPVEGVVRIGILSTAAVTRHLLQVIAAIKPESRCAVVTAVSSRSLDKAREFASRHQIPQSYGSHEELLRDADIDAVYIPLPNEYHAEYIVKALEAGRHVLCEKPLVLTVAEAETVLMATREAEVRCGRKIVVMEAVMSLYTAQTAAVKRLVDTKAIGDVLYMSGVFQYTLSRASHRQNSAVRGGGSLWDVGCYNIYLAQHLLGETKASSCHGVASWVREDNAQQEERCDESFFATVVYETASGRSVVLQSISSFSAPLCTTFRIQGTQGTIELSNPFKPTSSDAILLSVPGSAPETIVPADGARDSPYEDELRTFCDCVVRGSDSGCFTGPAYSLECTRIIVGLLQSAGNGGESRCITASA